jgi:DNA-directed RNA polymerase subunit RPC12/RpoP
MSPEENTVSNEAPVPKARILRQDYKDIQGKEAGLSVLSRLCLVVGIVGVLLCIIAGLAIGRLSLLAFGIALLIACLILFVIFGALSEIIRLLKAVNGLPYTGTISGSGTGTIYICSDCGSHNYPDIAKCRKCGAEFEMQGSEGQTS